MKAHSAAEPTQFTCIIVIFACRSPASSLIMNPRITRIVIQLGEAHGTKGFDPAPVKKRPKTAENNPKVCGNRLPGEKR